MFILAIVLLIAAIVTIVVAAGLRRDAITENRPTLTSTIVGGSGALLVFFSLASVFASTFYTQDVGEAKVLKDWTGNIVGEDITPGADFKAPWVDVVDFDIRNQIAAYVGDGFDDYNGSVPNGPQITVQERCGGLMSLQ